MVPIFGTYAFVDVNATLSGPGGVILLANNAGAADEGISFEATEDANKMTTGPDGSGFHTLISVRSARITARMLKTSPTNASLQQMLSYQRSSSVLWGKNAFDLTSSTTGDAVNAVGVAFARQPSNSWAKDPNMIEWHFDAIYAAQTLGGASVQ